MLKEIKIFEDENYLVVNKPAGLLVHGAPHIKEKSLADFLVEEIPSLKNVGESPDRPGIVHRLDKETSGLMVIPKNQTAFMDLKKQFQDRTIEKKYTALVFGRISKETGIIDFPIARSAKGYRMAALPKTRKGEANEDGRKAITEFWVIKNFINYTLVKAKIKTGRTHQIRVHFSACDHPLVGDNLYGTNITKIKNKKLALGRIFLVADELSFIDLNNEKKEFKIDLPKQLETVLDKVK